VQNLCLRLGIGPGSVVADVGCGAGPDTLVFASVVGEKGTVLAQELDANQLKKVVEAANKRGFHQVVPVLGQSDDPRLPDGFCDLIYMNRVFHHFSRPRDMLNRLWADLKPGGYLLIVDQQEGVLADWTPAEKREKEHHWTGETTVVRLGREAGFMFQDVLDDLWHEKQPFVLTFRRLVKVANEKSDPDVPRSLDTAALLRALPLKQVGHGPVLFFGLDRGRAILPALKAKLPADAQVFDVIPEEWALTREEVPADAPVAGTAILRTEKGDLAWPAELHPQLVLFVDAYHRLWDPAPLLRRLKQNLPRSALVAVADRKGPDTETRRIAGHHRRISPSLVVEEMKKAGFRLQRKLPAPAKDRFFLLLTAD
jgi:ubiquinone/menaquinone biosynthesis C-methylase UbiE